MQDGRDAQWDSALQQPSFGGGVLRNGIDEQAAYRAHLREMTTARQAAERRHASARSTEATMERAARQVAAEVRLAVLREELARIDGLHRRWLLEHMPVPAIAAIPGLRRAAAAHLPRLQPEGAAAPD